GLTPPARSRSNPSKNLETLLQRRIGTQKQQPVVRVELEIPARRHHRLAVADRGEEDRAARRSEPQVPERFSAGLPFRPDRDELDVGPSEGLVEPLGRDVGRAEPPEGVLAGPPAL